MSRYFEYFPRVSYNAAKTRYGDYELATNVMFRLRIVRNVISNAGSYFKYTIRDGDTPEILADKFYNDPETHWVILYANDMVDPQYDWPLEYNTFEKHIIDKYGSLATAKTTYHHYEKVIDRFNSTTNTTDKTRLYVDANTIVANANSLSVPYDSWTSLTETQAVETYEVSGDTVTQTTYRDEISYYDWEMEENEKKRQIKVIKNEYLGQIKSEFIDLTEFDQSFRRNIV